MIRSWTRANKRNRTRWLLKQRGREECQNQLRHNTANREAHHGCDGFQLFLMSSGEAGFPRGRDSQPEAGSGPLDERRHRRWMRSTRGRRGLHGDRSPPLSPSVPRNPIVGRPGWKGLQPDPVPVDWPWAAALGGALFVSYLGQPALCCVNRVSCETQWYGN